MSSDPERRTRQLANLRRGRNPAPPENQYRLVHGGYSTLLLADVEVEVRELMHALAEAAPVRDPDGSLPLADVVAVERAARALKRYRALAAWCDLHGRVAERTGDTKPAAELELKADQALKSALDALGMSPVSRARLGVDLARVRDLASEMSDD